MTSQLLGTLGELAARIGGRVVGDAQTPISRIAAIDEAGAGALTFATTPSYVQAALASKCAAVLLDETLLVDGAPKPLLAVANARAALAQLLRAFETPRKRGPFLHPTAVVAGSARLEEDVYVGAHVFVGEHAAIGARTVLEGGAYVGARARLGCDVLLHPRACLMDGCVVGDRTILHPGCVVGGDGFGFVLVDDRFERIPQVGNAILGDDVEIGANTCIDRAQTGSTSVGDGTKIDNLCQIGHNCRIGKHCGIAAMVGMAGSTIVGDYVQIGGQAGFKGHITIGSHSVVAAGSDVWGDLPGNALYSGRPARPHREELRREVMVRNLPKLLSRVEALEARKDGL